MEVICIKDNWKNSDYLISPIKGNIYNVDGCLRFDNGKIGYTFKEIPHFQDDARIWWLASMFTPLDSYKSEELKSELSEIFKKEKV